MSKFLKSLWRKLPARLRLLTALGCGGLSLILLAFIGLTIYSQTRSNSPNIIRRWFTDRDVRPALITERQPCPGAPFILPSDGFIGLLWRDPAGPYNIFNRHTGIDIFGDGASGEVPIFAVYDGYLTRLDNWVSTVIIRHADPLVPGRTIWSYYTHMASEDGHISYVADQFPPGIQEFFVPQGTLLGYQGEYAGSAAFRVGLHVHMSLVLSDEDGSFLNEAVLSNTIDPSPYFGMQLNIDELPIRPIGCNPDIFR